MPIFKDSKNICASFLASAYFLWAYHNKSGLEYADVKITNKYVDGEPQVRNSPQQTQTYIIP